MSDEDLNWIIPGEDYPLMIGKHKQWTVRELHLSEVSDIVRRALEYCLIEPRASKENIDRIKIEDRFALFIKILQLTAKSKCYPMFKKLLNPNQI